MNQETIDKIEIVISNMMDNIIRRRVSTEPFIETDIENNNPFGYRLVPIEIWKGAKFERSFVTSLGQGSFEQLARIIAEGTGAFAENQHLEDIQINTWRKEKIDDLLNLQRASQSPPDWNQEIKEVLELKTSRTLDFNLRFDLYIKRQNGKEEYYSMKTVKPNLDQTEKAKKDMLLMKGFKEDSETYFALPYNPAGEGNPYKSVHSIPFRIFNMNDNSSVLIGSSFWNKVGESEDTYNQLLAIFKRVGEKYSNIIRKDYLGLECESFLNISKGKLIKTESENHSGYGAGTGSIDTTTYECPCGKGTYIIEKDNIPGFREKSYSLNCKQCLSKYNFDSITGEITEKE